MASIPEPSQNSPGIYPDTEVIQVRTWPEGDEYVAALDEFNVHAFGATRQEAVRDLIDYLPEYLQMLESDGDNLAPWLIQERDALRSFATFTPSERG